MKILLFNDNPVVRKLVALSAQKTKDDLSVVWSTDEIEEHDYDLLIVDDALYSDELFESLNEKIVVKSTLFMATRGKAVPSGFDHVINKPFLPTDLVDMFVQIEKKVIAGSDQPGEESDTRIPDASAYAINLEDSLPDLENHDPEALDIESLGEAEDDFDFGNLEDYEEKLPETAILDQEEVQEVQGLLEDTESDDLGLEEEFGAQGIDALALSEEEVGVPIELEDDFSFEDTHIADVEDEKDEFLSLTDDIQENETLRKELLDEDGFDELELSVPIEESPEALEEDELLPMSEESDFDDMGLDEIDSSALMDDEALGNLESKIEDAVNGLESEDLERELESDDFDLDLNDEIMEELMPSEVESAGLLTEESEGFDELDMLDERELKMAVGEELEEDEPIVSVAKGDNSLAAETLDEVLNESSNYDDFADEIEEGEPASHAEGVEALQALLKALSNENVTKSLKGMNISININFGNGA